ncbi:MAG: hypothetical protein LQ352_003435 [Teloschistes flavicans]|nr:MAG: hypothetical protein LQ352_003435 [Teloschistes flavicans]
MANWRQDYMSALEARDRREKSQKTLCDACGVSTEVLINKLTDLVIDTKLADRTPGANARSHSRNTTPSGADPNIAKVSDVADRNASLQRMPDTETLAEMRQDLIEAQRSRGALQARIDHASAGLQQIKLQSAVDRKRLDELTQERTTLTQRLKDRDEELKGKAKLLEACAEVLMESTTANESQGIHDETVSLTLQLNMAEDQAQKLRNENENLVKRWMERMGKEADAMNEASRFT